MTRFDPASAVPGFDGLWDRLAAEVMRSHQAEATLWNGRIDYIPPEFERSVRGRATEDGRLLLSRPLVVEPLRRLYAEGPAALSDPKFAQECRRAIKTAAHELGHLTAPADWTIADRIRDHDRDEQDPAEEGFIEALTQQEMPGIIDRVLPAELAVPLARAVAAAPEPALPSYPGWTIATGTFAAELSAEFEGLRAIDVLRAGARESASRRADALAGLIVSRTRLPELLRDPERAAAFRSELAGVVGAGFAGLSDVPTARTAGMQRGERIAAGAIEKVRTSEQFFAQMADFGGLTLDHGIAPASGAVGSRPTPDHERLGDPAKPALGNDKEGPAGRG
ncbi:hypothetical protein EV137_2977 [Kribbella pratensis]|uniref:Uncharacterized protein n=1 Tax=Kribbella pratensis TaxID=2512112 RepID=A0ABY2FRT7_9ACTN|nr:hypothetical protein [Kribbella pratensis]TDW95633.1 hypothetical protein EV137_2977 [Kribbella pratensis]